MIPQKMRDHRDILRVGIFRPTALIGRYNTDFLIAKDFDRLSEFADVETRQVASRAYTLTTNLARLASKIKIPSRITRKMISYGTTSINDVDVVYHYGRPKDPRRFFAALKGKPAVVTIGFMSDQYVLESLGHLPDRQNEANKISADLAPARILHFHTENGVARLASYRPELRSKMVACPFFLPRLNIAKHAEKGSVDSGVKLLFVGAEGTRKGLDDLMSALELLGQDVIKTHKVSLTVVSKDKPNDIPWLPIEYFNKLPFEEVQKKMQAAKLFVMIPRRESYGLVFLEAMAHGCCVICDDDPTRWEILGGCGMHSPARVPGQLKEVLMKAFQNPELVSSLGKAAHRRASAEFDRQTVAEKYVAMFRLAADRP